MEFTLAFGPKPEFSFSFKYLLAYSPYSYIEIATYLGFSSQSHLGKVFKKYTGMTLRQYRGKYGQNFNK